MGRLARKVAEMAGCDQVLFCGKPLKVKMRFKPKKDQFSVLKK